MNKKKITWFGVARSTYNDYLFSQINKEFELIVYFRLVKLSSHPWKLSETGYKYFLLRNKLIKAITDSIKSDLVVISGWGYWINILIIFTVILFKVKKIYWTDTPNLSSAHWSGLKGTIRKVMSKIVFNLFEGVWSTGKLGVENIVKLGCSPHKVKSFPFFYDLNRYSNFTHKKIEHAEALRRAFSRSENDIIFMIMGQLIAWKKFDDVLNAFSKIKDNNSVLWIAGSGPEESYLKDLVNKLNLTDRVYFLGWLQSDQVEYAFWSSDVFIHPANNDPFPTVVLDAMTWGKPIIGSDSSGSVIDRVSNGVNGFIYKTGAVEALRNHIEFYIKNPELTKKHGHESMITALNYPVSDGIKLIKKQLND